MVELVEFLLNVLSWVSFAIFACIAGYWVAHYTARGWYKGKYSVPSPENVINLVVKSDKPSTK